MTWPLLSSGPSEVVRAARVSLPTSPDSPVRLGNFWNYSIRCREDMMKRQRQSP